MSSQVIKCVAGAGKTTKSLEILSKEKNGIYLAFNNSVVDSVYKKGFYSKTIDSFFQTFIIPRFTSQIPLISNGCNIEYTSTTLLNSSLKGIGNISIDIEGNILFCKKKIGLALNTSNEFIHNSCDKYFSFLRFIFDKETLRLTDELRADLSTYLLHHYKDFILEIIRNRFSCIIIDEAQDLSGMKESFAKTLYENNINLFVLGDENQNINGGGTWFENLSPTESMNHSFRCPEMICEWIRNNLQIEIYGENKIGEVHSVSLTEISKYDDGDKYLLYYSTNGNEIKKIIDNWSGPKDTIKGTKGDTINSDIVIIGKTLNKKALYTAMTRTTKNVYSTITKWN